MAGVRAVKSGNWSDTTVWNTGALPTSADDVWANNFTVAADTTTTVLSIRNGSTTDVTAGGGFTAVNGVTLTLTGGGVINGNSAATLTCNLTAGQSFTVAGNVTAAAGHGVNNTSSGTLNIIGNCSGGTGAGGGANGANNASTGTLNITGNCNNSATGNSCFAANNASSGTLNITGNCTGASSGQSSHGANNASIGTLNITGTCTCGLSAVGAVCFGVVNASTGILNHTGTAQAASTGAGIGPGSLNQSTFLTGPFIGTAQGVVANNAVRWRWVPSVGPSYMTAVNSTATDYKNLYTADSTDSASGQPAATNVRSGTVYGPSNELTGTCAVPPAGSVALGVPVDNTTGTAALTAADIQAALTAQGLTTARAAYLDRLPNTSTTQEVADIIDAAI